MSESLADTTDAELETLLADATAPILVEFHIPDCTYCARLEPLLEDAAETYAGRMTILRMDASTNATRPQYGLNGTPTLVLYINGQEKVTKTGAMREPQLRSFLNAYV